jgi:hypothetical protein
MGDEPAREAMILQHLRGQGIGRQHPSDPDLNQLESGHNYGIGKWGGGWEMQAWHPGDPSGSAVIADLGREDEGVADRVADQLRRPAFVRALGDQWQRAAGAGDPRGDKRLHSRSKWHGVSHFFHDFRDG